MIRSRHATEAPVRRGGLRLAAMVVSAALLLACSDEAVAPEVDPPPDAGSDADAPPAYPCPPGETPHDEGCRPAGVPPEECGAGFEADAVGGCVAVLPVEPCPDGWFAVPGETMCHEVAPCGTERWGAAPIDDTTEHVDAAYLGGASDGSVEQPWTSIQQGVDAAVPGAVVAIAAGTYPQPLLLLGKPVRLWGRCPALVEIGGPASEEFVLVVGSRGTELHDLAFHGAAPGISNATDVVLDRVWIHDTSSWGLLVADIEGPASARVTRSLVERAVELGVYVSGATVDVDATVIRATVAGAAFGAGRGIEVEHGFHGAAAVTLSGLLVEQSVEVGVNVIGSSAVLENVLVRGVSASAAGLGRGIAVQHGGGGPDGDRSTVTMRSTVIEDVEEIGMVVDGSAVDVESTVIRDVTALPSGTSGGRGMGVQYRPELSVRSEVTLRRSLIERSAEAGLTVTASDMVIESTAIRDSGPRPDGIQGIGVLVQHDLLGKPGEDTRSTAAIRWSAIETTHLAGVMIFASTATLEDTLVRDSRPQSSDAKFGDGVVVIGADVEGSATLKHVRVEHSARVGVASFGGTMSIGDTSVECAGIPLAGERLSDGANIHEPLFTDEGGNICGCEANVSACIVQSSNLGAPAALPP